MSKTKDLNRIAAALEAGNAPERAKRDTSAEPRTKQQIKKASRPLMYRIRVLFTSEKKSRGKALDRMSFPIMGFVGPNGGGKTLAAVMMAYLAMEFQNRKVLSTVPLLDPKTGELHRNYVAWTHWDQLLDWWDGDVLADEILSIASSRGAASLDPRAQTLLVQLRKRNARFWWTAPSYARADVIIREVTQAITECRGYYTDNTGRQERRGSIQSWAPKRLFHFATYDATEFDEWTAGKKEKATPLVQDWFHGVGSVSFKCYDTLGAVNVIAGVNDAGTCDTCNGAVSGKPKPCRCANPVLRPLVPLDEFRPQKAIEQPGGERFEVDQATGEIHDHELHEHDAPKSEDFSLVSAGE
jgi:hypothetical protein